MNKRELWLLVLLGVFLFIITTYVCVYLWEYEGFKLAGALFNALLNLGLFGFVAYQLRVMHYRKTYGNYVPYVMSVITFWQLEYVRNPVTDYGYRSKVDPKIVLLTIVCDPEFSKSINLPEIGESQLKQYYTSMYIRMVDCVGLPPKLTYCEFTKHMARYLLELTANSARPQTGLGIIGNIGKYDERTSN